MAKYADITPFYEWLDWLEKESNTSYPEYETLMFYEIRDKLDDLPEVVQCKDCKNYSYIPSLDKAPRCSKLCALHSKAYEPKPDDFCSMGERRK